MNVVYDQAIEAERFNLGMIHDGEWFASMARPKVWRKPKNFLNKPFASEER